MSMSQAVKKCLFDEKLEGERTRKTRGRSNRTRVILKFHNAIEVGGLKVLVSQVSFFKLKELLSLVRP